MPGKTFNVLVAGDTVGHDGRVLACRLVARRKAAGGIDFAVVNAENAAGGRGITGPIAGELFAAGADVLTMGDHAWDQRESYPCYAREPRLVRPLNFPPGCPGRGAFIAETPIGRVAVVQLLGRVFMNGAVDCPFRAIDAWLEKNPYLPAATHTARGLAAVLVDFHAEATSEKLAMRHHLDGRVTALWGTHTHVQTADETITAKGTAYLTDAGMTGPVDGVIGRDAESILSRFLTGMPARFDIAKGPVEMQGFVLSLDAETKKPVSIRRFAEREA